MKKIEAIICDMDGTLLNSKGEISDITKDFLIKAQEAGTKLILASGRPTNAMIHYSKLLEMDKHHGLLVSFNGACVIDVESMETVYTQDLGTDISKKMLKHLENFDVMPMIYNNNYMFVNDVYAPDINLGNYFNGELTSINVIKHESRNGNFLLSEIENLADHVDFPVYKILIAGDPDYLIENHKAIAEPFANDINSVFSAPFYYEITHNNVDKGITLDKVFNDLNINKENTVGFGDGHNDISLLKAVGIGVAMDNAVAEVKEIADAHTLSNVEDGIVSFLSKYYK